MGNRWGCDLLAIPGGQKVTQCSESRVPSGDLIGACRRPPDNGSLQLCQRRILNEKKNLNAFRTQYLLHAHKNIENSSPDPLPVPESAPRKCYLILAGVPLHHSTHDCSPLFLCRAPTTVIGACDWPSWRPFNIQNVFFCCRGFIRPQDRCPRYGDWSQDTRSCFYQYQSSPSSRYKFLWRMAHYLH